MDIQEVERGVYRVGKGEESIFLRFYEGYVRVSSSLSRPSSLYSPIIALPSPKEAKVKNERGSICLTSEDIEAKIGEDLALSFSFQGKKTFSSFPFQRKKEGFSHNGEVYGDEVSFPLRDGDHFYGVGDHAGPLDKRNYEVINWNTDYVYAHVEVVKSLYKSFPFFLSKNLDVFWGLFLDNPSKTLFNFGVDCEKCLFSSKEGGMDFYLFFGDVKTIMKNYTSLTGRPPLPARWTLGYHQSRWSYDSEEKVRSIVKGFIDNDLPLSCIHLDIDYMDSFKVFTIDKKKFPNPEKLFSDLSSLGVHVVAILDPGVKKEEGYDVYEEGMKERHFATENGVPYVGKVWPGESLFPSFNDEGCAKWWGEHVKSFAKRGISGIWCDMNEPTSFTGELPGDVSFAGLPSSLAHNIYGDKMAKATYDALDSLGKRPFLITRAAYVGTCRYSTVWTGDNQSIWDHLRLAIPQEISLGLSGMPLVGTDIGGFCGDTTPELLTRWIGLGLFSPLMRNHCPFYNRPQEPWTFTPKVTDDYRKALRLRYRLLPYLYDLAFGNVTAGLPFMRPLFMEFPREERLSTINDEFMEGESLLVSPVVEAGTEKKLVFFPKGKWYDFFSGKLYEEDSIVEAPLGSIPLFAREGSIIPLAEEGEYDLDKSPDVLILKAFLGQGTLTHYEDEGEGKGYENGEYNLIRFTNLNGKVEGTYLHHGYRDYKKIIVEFEGDRKEISIK